jgi:hypothetical protein
VVGNAAREVHLVRDDQHAHAFFRELLHHVEDFADRFGFECRGRFVERSA